MKKADIIKEIQIREAELWLEFIKLDIMENESQEDIQRRLCARSKWSSVYMLMQKLKIESDYTLVEGIEAEDIMFKKGNM